MEWAYNMIDIVLSHQVSEHFRCMTWSIVWDQSFWPSIFGTLFFHIYSWSLWGTVKKWLDLKFLGFYTPNLYRDWNWLVYLYNAINKYHIRGKQHHMKTFGEKKYHILVVYFINYRDHCFFTNYAIYNKLSTILVMCDTIHMGFSQNP